MGIVGIMSAFRGGEILENKLKMISILGAIGGYLGLRLWGWWQTLVDIPERKHQQTRQTGEVTDKRQASTPQPQACPGSPQAKHPNEEES
jgi:hypothetical protein